jgi:cytochrome P450
LGLVGVDPHVSDRRSLTRVNSTGKHACPGRFFAGNELKAMMAHLLLHYDIGAEVEGVRPKNVHMGQAIMPNMGAKVMFRKRRA